MMIHPLFLILTIPAVHSWMLPGRTKEFSFLTRHKQMHCPLHFRLGNGGSSQTDFCTHEARETGGRGSGKRVQVEVDPGLTNRAGGTET